MPFSSKSKIYRGQTTVYTSMKTVVCPLLFLETAVCPLLFLDAELTLNSGFSYFSSG